MEKKSKPVKKSVKRVVWDTAKKKPPLGEIVRIFPKFNRLSKAKKVGVALEMITIATDMIKKYGK